MRPVSDWHVATLCLTIAMTACGETGHTGSDAGCDQGEICRDSDCDRICDADEGYPDRDTDEDGVPDYLDTDSDGDGIDDREEAGDGDLSTAPFDRNQNGIPDVIEPEYPLRAGNIHNPPADGGMGWSPSPQMDASAPMIIDGGGQYAVDGGTVDELMCPATDQVPTACADRETDCDGLDNDCDGEIDEAGGCDCERGTVRSCFAGPPGRRGVGACADGHQVCMGEEFPYWGPCEGGVPPSTEVCDGVDNDCNGCTDEVLDCGNMLTCPEPGDARIITGKPFEQYELDAADFYQGGEATGYRWEIEGSPCDVLFGAIDESATSESGKLSYQLEHADQAQATVRFSLSGQYAVRLTVETPDGELGCTWNMPVQAPGVRVELCWPHTGPWGMDEGRVDLDLHLARQGSTSKWSYPKDCYHQTCAGADSIWGHSASQLPACQGSPNTAVYETIGYCPNPRLDADNRLDQTSYQAYLTENINFDNPTDGDRLRVMVQHNDNSINDAAGSPEPPQPLATQPLVNVYCGGTLKATFGGSPGQLVDDPDEVTGFDTPGQRWQVADIAVEGSGDTTDCTISPLRAPEPATGYWIDDGMGDVIAW